MRARDHGIAIGEGTPGPLNAITDVAGVRVGHTTLIEGIGPADGGARPSPDRRDGGPSARRHLDQPVFAGAHRLNGNGEMTGLEWVRESGLLTSPVALTNTHSVGVVRDALLAEMLADERSDRDAVGPARGGRDVGRRAERHQRLSRARPSTSRAALAARRWTGGRGRRSAAARA